MVTTTLPGGNVVVIASSDGAIGMPDPSLTFERKNAQPISILSGVKLR